MTQLWGIKIGYNNYFKIKLYLKYVSQTKNILNLKKIIYNCKIQLILRMNEQ